jgi:hypothetical protein
MSDWWGVEESGVVREGLTAVAPAVVRPGCFKAVKLFCVVCRGMCPAHTVTMMSWY